MNFLDASFDEFASWLRTTAGLRFRGIVMPLKTDIPVGGLNYQRHALRVRCREVVKATDVVLTAWQERFLVGDNDLALDGGNRFQRTHRLYRITRDIAWQQQSFSIDDITGQQKSGPRVDKGLIPVSEEQLGALERDRGTYLMFDKLHVITGAPVQLGDILDGKQVKRVIQAFGVFVAEIE